MEQKDFFTDTSSSPKSRTGFRPLAARMRPRSLDEVVGQDHIVGPDCLLPRLVATGNIGSLIFYGPPGTGKTSMAEAIANQMQCRFVPVNAVLSNTAEIRDILKMARYRSEESTILFIDEIHRFNKSQQDLLLPDVEAGNIRLIGATTHNPGFYINAPLLSRSHLFRLNPVSEEAIVAVLQRAMNDAQRGFAAFQLTVDPLALRMLARISDGDLRRALNALETLVLAHPKDQPLTEAAVQQFAAERQIRYDATEDEHYDTASAFIKSMRGSDPDAALYWLAKMLEGGEDPRFIARRLVIFASEDVGLADSRALPLAVACFHACELIGLPECQLNLAHVTVFLAVAPKSNSTTTAIASARDHIRKFGLQPVPPHLKDSHTAFNKSIGNGVGYQYSHLFPNADCGQQFMLNPTIFFHPSNNGAEKNIQLRRK